LEERIDTMRWFWIDRFTEFVQADRAAAVKNVTLAEEALDDYLPGYPHYPHSLIVEGVAQTGGLLVAEIDQFQQRVVLAKINKANFSKLAIAGDQLQIAVQIQDLQTSGAIISASVTCNQQSQAELEMSFAFLGERFGSSPLFPPEDLLRMLRILRMYDVAVDKEGRPLRPPKHLLDAEADVTKFATN
jgi:3-hydroxyacyl-[acyl-carrier-protein] dehydratase